jgi:UDP-glucose 4-epimerase
MTLPLHYLVTGGAGFIGSHLTDRLLAEGNKVTVIDNLSTGHLSNLDDAGRNPNFRFAHGSIIDEVFVDELIQEADVIVHLAAAVGVELIVNEPLRSFLTNVRGSEVMIEHAHRYRRKILIASTSEIYGKNTSDLLSETSDRVLGSPAIARWSYSTAKAVDEILAFAYHRERGLPSIVARFFNTVGPRQSPMYGMVIPRLIWQALRNEPITVYGDGEQTRCFCHVSDTVEAIIRLLNHESAIGDVFNIGAGSEISMRALAESIVSRTNSTSEITMVPYEVAYPKGGFEDMRRRVPDTTKLFELTGWKTSRDLNSILDETIKDARREINYRSPESV